MTEIEYKTLVAFVEPGFCITIKTIRCQCGCGKTYEHLSRWSNRLMMSTPLGQVLDFRLDIPWEDFTKEESAEFGKRIFWSPKYE